jgi:hypothetical protein
VLGSIQGPSPVAALDGTGDETSFPKIGRKLGSLSLLSSINALKLTLMTDLDTIIDKMSME